MMTPREPFKFLDAYTKEDKDIFFGRDAEIEDVYSRVLQSSLLLVYGPSGTGKTSLIQCGLSNKLEDPDWLLVRESVSAVEQPTEGVMFDEADWLPVFIRYGENIFRSIDHELSKQARTEMKPEALLGEKLESLYLDYFKPVYLIFDQFEELFIFGSADEAGRLAQELAALENLSFEVRVIFVIREEYLAELTVLEPNLPDWFMNRFRVERMGRSNAISVIESPCKVCGTGLEEGLADRILERLGMGKTGTVELTYLQVLLDKLYKKAVATNPDTPELTRTDLEALGSMGDILGGFLEEQLAAMSEEDASLGEAVLKTFITPDGTKKTMGMNEIISSLSGMGRSVSAEQVTAILTHFTSVRILKEKEESGHYELRHDSLAQKIFERMTALEKDLLEVLQTVENRYKEYQTRGTLLDKTALDYVAPYQNRLRFKPQIAEFITTSRHEFTRVRRKRVTALFAILIAILIVVSGLGISSYRNYLKAVSERQKAEEHLRQSQINEIDALILKSKPLIHSHNQLEALFTGVKAGILLKQVPVPSNLKSQAIFNLLEIFGSIHEKKSLVGHESPVYYVTFSPDGTMLASGGTDGTLKLWGVLDGREIVKWQGYGGSILSIKFSPDGKILASGSDDYTVKIWNVTDGREIKTLEGHSGYSVAFSLDGQLLASGSGIGEVTLWNTANGQEIKTLQGHSGAVYGLNFSPDGTLLASGSADGTIKFWNIADGKEVITLNGELGVVWDVDFSPDGTILVSGSGSEDRGVIKLWNVTKGREIDTLEGHSRAVLGVNFSPDGALLASGSGDRTIILWNVSDGRVIKILHGHFYPVHSVAFSPDGKMLASGNGLMLDQEEVIEESGEKPGEEIGANGVIKLWDVTDGEEILTLLGHTGRVNSVKFSPDGTLLASGSEDNTIKLWNVDMDLDDLLVRGCKWLHNYLKTNPYISESDRRMCDDILQ